MIIDELVCLKASDDGRTCVEYAPSDKLLDPGDKLLKVDGTSLSVVDDLAPILAKHRPGDTVTIDYERDGKTGSGEVQLIASPDEPERTIIGFLPSDTSVDQVAEDITIKIETESIEGHRRPCIHVDVDRRVDGRRPVGRQANRRDGHDHINGQVGAIGDCVEGFAVRSLVLSILVPTNQGEADIAKARLVVGDAVEIIPVSTLDEAWRHWNGSAAGRYPPWWPTRRSLPIPFRSRPTAPRQGIATIFVARRPTLALNGTFVFTS